MEQCFAYWLALNPNWDAISAIATALASIGNLALAAFGYFTLKDLAEQRELRRASEHLKGVFAIRRIDEIAYLFILNAGNNPIAVKSLHFSYPGEENFHPLLPHTSEPGYQAFYKTIIPSGESGVLCRASVNPSTHWGRDEADSVIVRVHFFGTHFESGRDFIDVRMEKVAYGKMGDIVKVIAPASSASIPILVPQSPE